MSTHAKSKLAVAPTKSYEIPQSANNGSTPSNQYLTLYLWRGYRLHSLFYAFNFLSSLYVLFDISEVSNWVTQKTKWICKRKNTNFPILILTYKRDQSKNTHKLKENKKKIKNNYKIWAPKSLLKKDIHSSKTKSRLEIGRASCRERV